VNHDQARHFHTVLKDIVSRYSRAWGDFERAMAQGNQNKADEAMSQMQEIEQSVTILPRIARL